MRVSAKNIQIPNYTIVDLLGEGGLGKVYRAYKSNFTLQGGTQEIRKYFAIKVIDVEKAKEHADVDTLIHEIKISSQINYPNIVQVFDFGIVNDSIYIVMEMLEGFSLGDILRFHKDPIPEDVALAITHEVAKTLRYVHFEHLKGSKESIVHADISLQNIFIEKHTYRTKLMDFGCAKKVQRGTRYTIGETESIFANVFFAAPEQARQQWLDIRSDIYSLGVVFYDLVTNTRSRDLPLNAAHIKACDGLTVDRSVLTNRNLGNSAIIGKMLELDPAKRYQSADHLLEAIERRLSALSFSYVDSQKDLKRIFATVEAAYLDSTPTKQNTHLTTSGEVTKPLTKRGANQTRILPKKPKDQQQASAPTLTNVTKNKVQPVAVSHTVSKTAASNEEPKANRTKLTVIPLVPRDLTKYAIPAALIFLVIAAMGWWFSGKPDKEPSLNKIAAKDLGITDIVPNSPVTSKGGETLNPNENSPNENSPNEGSEPKTSPGEGIGGGPEPRGEDGFESPTPYPKGKPKDPDQGESEVPNGSDEQKDQDEPNGTGPSQEKGKDSPDGMALKPTPPSPKNPEKEYPDKGSEAPGPSPSSPPGKESQNQQKVYKKTTLIIVSRSPVWRNLKILDLRKKGRRSVIYNKPLVNKLVFSLGPGRYRLIAKHPKIGKPKVKTIVITESQATRRVAL